MSKLTTIEGVGPATAEKLAQSGIRSVNSLLKAGSTASGRRQIAEKTGRAILNS